MEFKIFNYVIDITITKIKNPILYHVAELLLQKKRLSAIGEIKDNYNISSLKEIKVNIIDKICMYTPNNKLIFHIKNKHKIVSFLQKNLEKYEKKL